MKLYQSIKDGEFKYWLHNFLTPTWGCNLYYGIGNLFKYFRVIWEDRDWDWVFIIYLLEFKLRNVAAHERKFGHHLTSKRDARNIEIAAGLCKRILEDDYAKLATSEINPYATKEWGQRWEYLQKQDIDYLFRFIAKNIRGWWD